MSEKQIFVLLNELWKDVGFVEFYWLLAALAAILAVSWWLSSRLRRNSEIRGIRERQNMLIAFGAGSLKRIAFPLIAWGLVVLLCKVLTELNVSHLSLLSLASPLLLSWVIVRAMVYMLRSVFPHGEFLRNFERVITLAVWCVVILEITGLSGPVIGWLEQVKLPVGKQKLDLWTVVHGSVTVLVILLLALWVASFIERRLVAAERMDANLREVLARLIKAFLLLLALLMGLTLVGIDITTLSIFSGALAVGLGLGLQKIASNYVSGFIILLDRSIRLGNLVALDDKTTGIITRITARYTVLRILSGSEVIIPNEYLVNNTVRNLSFSDGKVRVATAIAVAYDSDVEQVIALMEAAARKHPRVITDPAPFVMLTAFAENGINLELGVWISDPENGMGNVRSEVNLEILRVFRQNGIQISYPQREVRLARANRNG